MFSNNRIILPCVWVLSCLLLLFWEAKLLPQNWHVKGFSPVWVLSCLLLLLWNVKLLPQNLHLKGFSPVWVLSCAFKSLLWKQVFGQNLHWNMTTFVWMFSCLTLLPLEWKLCPQNWHANGFSPVWVLSWSSLSLLRLNFFSQYLQDKEFGFPLLSSVILLNPHLTKLSSNTLSMIDEDSWMMSKVRVVD